jgi:CubicO group peptidase (beta-lactamase class C family)
MKKSIIVVLICLTVLFALSAISINADVSSEAESAHQTFTNAKLYGIGSVSKVFTAAAVMKLVEQEKIQLDEPLVTYMPKFTMADTRYTNITPRMLLSHSSGLMGSTGMNDDLIGDNDTYHHDHFIETLSRQKLKHEPGDRSIYSNDSFTLAELLIEHVSGMSFTEFIEREFAAPLGLTHIETSQSDFDRNTIASSYLGNSELNTQNLNTIGSGGMYAAMDDLCRFAAIFMDSADGSILSKESVNEMAKVQHKMELGSPNADTSTRYGLGWDCVELYPFNQFNIKAIGKGGSTGGYESYLMVLPEHNLAAAVASFGGSGQENLIAQEIIMAVLEEEGLIPSGTALSMPQQNLTKAAIPDSRRKYAGLYDGGIFFGILNITFTDNSMIITPIGARNERSKEFFYNTDGEFVSEKGDHFGLNGLLAASSPAQGITALTFTEGGKYLVAASAYEYLPGLSQNANPMPIAERIEVNPVSPAAQRTWDARNDKQYLLVSEKHTSNRYIHEAVAKTLSDERLSGYVLHGLYKAGQRGGKMFPAAKIADQNNAFGYQSTPTMTGRDIVNITITKQNGVEYLSINDFRYIDAVSAKVLSAFNNTVIIENETVWVDIDAEHAGNALHITAPDNASWFVYDDKMNCIATSLEKNVRNTIILPKDGIIAFAGEPGAAFMLQ